MGNDRNTVALKRELDTFFGGTGLPLKTEDLARHLAARGVLVPSALEAGDAALLIAAAVKGGLPPSWVPNDTGLVRQLEKIAKGEA